MLQLHSKCKTEKNSEFGMQTCAKMKFSHKSTLHAAIGIFYLYLWRQVKHHEFNWILFSATQQKVANAVKGRSRNPWGRFWTTWAISVLKNDRKHKYSQTSIIRCTKSPKLIVSNVSSCSCLCAIHWNQVLSQEWRFSWSIACRCCSNFICMIKNLFLT